MSIETGRKTTRKTKQTILNIINFDVSNHLDYECETTIGDGEGDDEDKIGDQTGDDCIRACIDMKKENDMINGVTLYANDEPGIVSNFLV